MAIERERKFLVNAEKLPPLPMGVKLEAGYFTDGPVAIRVTARDTSAKCKVCFKGPGTEEREEFEYTIPCEDARSLLKLAPTYLRKIRVEFEGWEIDVFNFDGRQLWIAEWEEAEGKPSIPVPLPDWIGIEVTDIPEFTNMKLAWKYGRK